MRCREARQRLMTFKGIIPANAENIALMEHIRQCPECAAFMKAEYTLRQRIKTVYGNDNIDMISMQELKNRVESRVRFNPRSPSREINIMDKIADQIRTRPKFGISLAAVMVILLVATLVPMRWERTIGYDVAIAGVNKDLAMDKEKVHLLLAELGMKDVEYNIDGCESTCQLTLSRLESEDDVNIVAAAFNKLGDCKLKEVVPICEDETGSLLKKVTINIFKKPVVRMRMEQVYRYVDSSLEQLNELTQGDFDIWITPSKCVEGGTDVIFIKNQDTGSAFEAGRSDGSYHDIRIDKTDLSRYDKYSIHHVTDNNGEFVILKNEDHTWRFNLNVEDDLRKLEDLGVDIETARLANGEFPSSIYIPKSDSDIQDLDIMDDTDVSDGILQYLDEFSAVNCSVQEVIMAPDGSGSIKLLTEEDEVLWINVADMKSWDDMTVSANSMIEVNSIDSPQEKLLLVKKGGTYYLKGIDVDFTGNKDNSEPVPNQFALHQNYPNPFNPLTTVIYSLPGTEHVTIEIFNINGQKVRTLVNESKGAGDHSVIWDSTDDDGKKVASGVYMYRITAGEFTESRKMTLTK